ncbi:flagellar biosynthesis anti-sigma factor FlgM [Thalassotalea sp. 1_MG-2023]|uniref:flagellar biosynthesis anti-sigma factor FlgM n=1 Tax=Thalassotalea sp. 1_MG-2023 TaxID=3062680 RepID=UPI0026E43FE6|nr:flagellar biosynthesis anti-sigma factor FlgM [Thalassotalea sp. 1_MG-2023]MDO6426427.1 flagellar biosynthesis anti-sigma factor FlgM [Thalassotalea sp. 1_MG-2023]
MAININNLSNSGQVKQKVDQQTQLKQQQTQNTTNSEQAKVASKDSFSITPQAKQLGDLQKKVENAPIVDQKKVEELKKAITSGDYKVDPEKLAASIANFEFDLAESI